MDYIIFSVLQKKNYVEKFKDGKLNLSSVVGVSEITVVLGGGEIPRIDIFLLLDQHLFSVQAVLITSSSSTHELSLIW